MSEEGVSSGEESGNSPVATPDIPEPDAANRLDDEVTGAGSLLDPEAGDALEAEDRKKPIPGGEPECPLCATKMTRKVEKHPAPRGGSSPFRVRLLCPNGQCRVWTVYDW